MSAATILDPTTPAFNPTKPARRARSSKTARRAKPVRCTSRLRKIVECYSVFQHKHYIEIHLMDSEVLILGTNEYIQYYAVIRDAYVNGHKIAYLRLETQSGRPPQVFINTRTLENRKTGTEGIAERYKEEQKLTEARLTR